MLCPDAPERLERLADDRFGTVYEYLASQLEPDDVRDLLEHMDEPEESDAPLPNEATRREWERKARYLADLRTRFKRIAAARGIHARRRPRAAAANGARPADSPLTVSPVASPVAGADQGE
jgi:hypothetical protein